MAPIVCDCVWELVLVNEGHSGAKKGALCDADPRRDRGHRDFSRLRGWVAWGGSGPVQVWMAVLCAVKQRRD